jgi:hypothetical protein
MAAHKAEVTFGSTTALTALKLDSEVSQGADIRGAHWHVATEETVLLPIQPASRRSAGFNAGPVGRADRANLIAGCSGYFDRISLASK